MVDFLWTEEAPGCMEGEGVFAKCSLDFHNGLMVGVFEVDVQSLTDWWKFG